MNRLLILLSLTLNSCTSTKYWGLSDHAEMMQHCQLMCDLRGVKNYSPITGTCSCGSGDAKAN